MCFSVHRFWVHRSGLFLKINVEHRTSNAEHRIMMSLRSAFFLCDVVSFMDRIPYMKLRQNGIVSFSIRLAAFQARGAARMKLHGIRFQSKVYLTAELAEHAEII